MALTWSFDENSSGFTYVDDAFRGTRKPAYEAGAYTATMGYSGTGGLAVKVGGIDEADITGMSGGWQTTFNLASAQSVSLTFRFKLSQTGTYEQDEYTDALVSVDGTLRGVGGNDFVARIIGDGNSGGTRTTLWREVTVDLGELAAGNHTLRIGAYNNKKTTADESSQMLFDDVAINTDDDSGGDGGGGGGGTGLSLEAFEAEVLRLTNEFRVQNGREPLTNDARLNDAAEDWSLSMAEGDFFRHSTSQFTKDHGYDWNAWGENIAAGQTTPQQVVNAWKNSSGHRANMLRESFEDIGIGHTYLENDTGSYNYHHYWVQVFGADGSDALMV